MSVNLKNKQRFTITDFSGGLNEFASSYKVADNELIECENISLRDSGGIKSSTGNTIYQKQTYLEAGNDTISTAVTNSYRYTRTDGTKKMILYAGEYLGVGSYDTSLIWADDDAGNFDKIARIESNTGKLRFAQFRDTLLMGTSRQGVVAYDPDFTFDSASTYPNSWAVSMDPQIYVGFGGQFMGADVSEVGNGVGKLDTGAVYYYIFTLDRGGGSDGDFLGETSPIEHQSLYTHTTIGVTADLTASTTNDAVVKLTKPQDGGILTNDVQRVNIYRSIPYKVALVNWDKKNIEAHFIGSITASKYTDAATDDVLFEDEGASGDGPLAEYGKMRRPPKPEHLVYHSGRMWLANVNYVAYGSSLAGVTQTAPHRLFMSHINNHGNQEPGVFHEDLWIDIDPTSGEGITGIISYRNEVLVVFKANSTWAITGDTYGSFSVRNLSQSVGCVAPETIQVADGAIVWLSHSGVYYFDGGKPKQLKSDNIYDTIKAIPAAQRVNACGIYDVDRREYLLAHAGNDTGGYNNYVSKFDLRTGSWSKEKKIFGVSSFVQKKTSDESVQTFAGIGDNPTAVALYSSVIRLNDGWITGGVTASLQPIDFSFRTKFYDGGFPYADKNFEYVLVELSSPEDLTLNVWCDNRLDTKINSSGFTIKKPTGNDLIWYDVSSPTSGMVWNDSVPTNSNVWPLFATGATLVTLSDKCWGKRISLEISGSVKSRVEVVSITVFYTPREGVRR
jgi:hypothetical protein